MNLRNDFLSGLFGASIIAATNLLEILRHMDYYGREGLLWNETLWGFSGFVFFIVLWIGGAAAGR